MCVFCEMLVGIEKYKVFVLYIKKLIKLKEKGWSNRVSSNILMVCLIKN